MHTARRRTACRNCGAHAPLAYCPRCGQDTAMHPPSLGEFLHEFVGHYVALEGRLARTLLALLQPGRLTTEYLAGRKARYVLPLRLFLTFSFCFFLALRLQTAVSVGVSVPVASNAAAAAATPADPPGVAIACDGAASAWCAHLERRVQSARQRMAADGEGAQAQLLSRLLGTLPYAVFLLLPVFAGLLKLAYLRRGMRYGEHLVFAFHVHSFWLVAALLALLVPPVPAGVLVATMPLYTVLAQRRVYRGRFVLTLLRAFAIAVPYLLLAATASLALLLYAFVQ